MAACLANAQGKMTKNGSEGQKNKEEVIKFNTAYWQSGNVEITKELLADNYVNHLAPPNGPDGRALMVGLMTGFKKGFSNVSVEFTGIIGEGDIVSIVKTITATHTGEFMVKQQQEKNNDKHCQNRCIEKWKNHRCLVYEQFLTSNAIALN